MKGFIEFLREQGVVGLAIGFMLGGAISRVVAAFVADIVNPIIEGLFGGINSLVNASFQIGSVQILWGDFVAVTVDFLIIAAIIYFLFKGLKLDRLDKKKKV